MTGREWEELDREEAAIDALIVLALSQPPCEEESEIDWGSLPELSEEEQAALHRLGSLRDIIARSAVKAAESGITGHARGPFWARIWAQEGGG